MTWICNQNPFLGKTLKYRSKKADIMSMNTTPNLIDQITSTVVGEWDVRQSDGVPTMALYHNRPQGLFAGWTDAQIVKGADGTVRVTFFVSGMSAGSYVVNTAEEADELFAKRYAR